MPRSAPQCDDRTEVTIPVPSAISLCFLLGEEIQHFPLEFVPDDQLITIQVNSFFFVPGFCFAHSLGAYVYISSPCRIYNGCGWFSFFLFIAS